MCGIAGLIGSRKDDSVQRVATMLSLLERRGPDDRGLEQIGNAVLGHRRLSIFDLSDAGHQPMRSASGQTAIVFNGAIYNFRQLKDDLKSAGVSFKSRTDTEVLLEGYEQWGIQGLLKRIDGMFAFALWDASEESLYLVRDRLGVKPLVYSQENGELAFASTIRALRGAGIGTSIDKSALIEYLEFGFVTDDNAIYENVAKVPPASFITYKDGKVVKERYWELPATIDDTISFEDAVDETERLFLEAVDKRLFADVPVGALLSGGIDSSLVCWAVSELGGAVTAFTVGVPGDEWDETDIAAQTARRLGIRHEVLELTSGALPDLSALTNAYSEPFACASALGLIDISQEVRKHATVLLTGDGGDDVFLGYPEHLHFHAAGSVARMTPEAVGILIRKLADLMPGSGRIKRAKSFISYTYGGLGGVTRARDGMPVYRAHNLLGDTLLSEDFPDRSIPLAHGEDLLREFLVYDRKTRFTGEYLTKVDGGTMYHALEARSPFLDSRLWEFAAALPFSVRLHQRTHKAVLREIVRKRIDPELATGSKKGFGVPVQRWLVNEWSDLFRESLSDSRAGELGIINPETVLEMYEKAVTDEWAPRQLWFILVLENWLRSEGI